MERMLQKKCKEVLFPWTQLDRKDKALPLYVALVKDPHSDKVTALITHLSREVLEGIYRGTAIGGKATKVLSHTLIPLPEVGRQWALETYARATGQTNTSLGLEVLFTSVMKMVADGTLDPSLLKKEK